MAIAMRRCGIRENAPAITPTSSPTEDTAPNAKAAQTSSACVAICIDCEQNAGYTSSRPLDLGIGGVGAESDHLSDEASSWTHTIVQWTRAYVSCVIDF
jgi:hypothetical protein